MVDLWYRDGDYWVCIETNERVHKKVFWWIKED